MLEKAIEKKVCEKAKKCGWLVYKFVSPGHAGVPDRMFIRDGTVMFIEFKQLGKHPTKLQEHHIKRIQEQGIDVHVIDNIEDGNRLVENYADQQR